MSFCLILLSAGKSSRFGSNLAKPYQKIGAKTLLEINLNKINSYKLIKKVVVAYNRKDKKLINSLKLKNVHLIPGGNTRQDSTFKALKYAKKFKGITKVLIHDVARPNFSKNLLKSIINKGKKYKSVIPILKISDAIKQKHNDNIVARVRDNFFITQTPQCFNFKEIYKLHIVNKYKYIDDDFSLLKDFKNIKLIKKLTKTKAKFIYLSTGLSSYKEIAKILNRINLKKIILIHTSFDEKLKNINFNRIKELRARFNVPVAYGNHSKFLSSIYKSISFKPHAIFFYVKLNRNLNYPDNKHAFKVKNIKKLVSKIDYNFNLIKKI